MQVNCLKCILEATLDFIGQWHLKRRLQAEYLMIRSVPDSLPCCWEKRENRLLERVEKEAGEGWW
jgi:hypothetical protein